MCRCPWQFEAFLIAEVAAVSGHHGDSAAAFLSRLAVALGPDNEPLLAEACRVVLEPLFALTSPEAVPQLFKRLEVRGLVLCCVWGAAMCSHTLASCVVAGRHCTAGRCRRRGNRRVRRIERCRPDDVVVAWLHHWPPRAPGACWLCYCPVPRRVAVLQAPHAVSGCVHGGDAAWRGLGGAR